MVAMQASNTGGTGSALLVPNRANRSQWINCASPAAVHWGLNMTIQDMYAPGGGSSDAWRFQWTYNMSFRGPRGLN
jgi:hypothetical protein